MTRLTALAIHALLLTTSLDSLPAQTKPLVVHFQDGTSTTLSDWTFVYEFGSSDVKSEPGVRRYQPLDKRSAVLSLGGEAWIMKEPYTLGIGLLKQITFEWPKEGDGLTATRITRCDGSTFDGGRLEPAPSFLSARPYAFATKIVLEGSTPQGHFRRDLRYQRQKEEPLEQARARAIRSIDFAGC